MRIQNVAFGAADPRSLSLNQKAFVPTFTQKKRVIVDFRELWQPQPLPDARYQLITSLFSASLRGNLLMSQNKEGKLPDDKNEMNAARRGSEAASGMSAFSWSHPNFF